jgi:hypothetical protein
MIDIAIIMLLLYFWGVAFTFNKEMIGWIFMINDDEEVQEFLFGKGEEEQVILFSVIIASLISSLQCWVRKSFYWHIGAFIIQTSFRLMKHLIQFVANIGMLPNSTAALAILYLVANTRHYHKAWLTFVFGNNEGDTYFSE